MNETKLYNSLFLEQITTETKLLKENGTKTSPLQKCEYLQKQNYDWLINIFLFMIFKKHRLVLIDSFIWYPYYKFKILKNIIELFVLCVCEPLWPRPDFSRPGNRRYRTITKSCWQFAPLKGKFTWRTAFSLWSTQACSWCCPQPSPISNTWWVSKWAQWANRLCSGNTEWL